HRRAAHSRGRRARGRRGGPRRGACAVPLRAHRSGAHGTGPAADGGRADRARALPWARCRGGAPARPRARAEAVVSPSPFDEDTRLEPAGDGRFVANLSERWWAYKSPWGGYIAAVLMRALVDT